MPPVIALAAVGAGAFVAARWARRALTKLDSRRHQADLDQRSSAARPVGTLTVDPESGVYRPK